MIGARMGGKSCRMNPFLFVGPIHSYGSYPALNYDDSLDTPLQYPGVWWNSGKSLAALTSHQRMGGLLRSEYERRGLQSLYNTK
jgi:hypothetical protein